MKITIDGSKANNEYRYLYKGQGMISCNGSSRLLLDYRERSPEAYWKILDLTFGKKGLKLTHFKLEMGSDVNTSSGTEPTVMRYYDEKADVTRGAGFILAADIKKIAPDVTLDMLWWSEPKWVTDSDDVHAARYRWYKETLVAAYETYGLKFDYVSANRNERAVDSEWIKYLSRSLRNETDCPYDFSKIKIIAADECHSFNISECMLNDPELMDAVDIIGSHYISHADDNTKLISEKFGKEIWFSEGSSPMVCAESACRFDEGRSGISGLNGAIDIADRMITMVSSGYMTMYEYQPAIAAYYDGVTYCHKQLINACSPWNGCYTLDSGFYMHLHFSMFIEKGWSYIFPACHADGVAGGDGHCITGAKYSFITACGKSGDYSVIITNSTSEPISYDIDVKNLGKADNMVYVWETRGPDKNERYDKNYFKKIAQIKPKASSYSVIVKPYSIVTVSTLDIEEPIFDKPTPEQNTILSLPFRLETDMSDEFIASRGGAPLYTTDEGGAFEITELNGEKVIMQKITPEIKSEEWGATPQPVTTFGDDRWYNYSVSADVLLQPDSYAGIGLRYTLVEPFVSGYAFHIYSDGTYKLFSGDDAVAVGKTDDFDENKWHTIKALCNGKTVSAFIDGVKVLEYVSESKCFGGGRAALYSSYSKCCFKNVDIEPVGERTYIEKYDNMSDIVGYSENGWEHITIGSYRCYKRTVSHGSIGAILSLSFKGSGIVFTGAQEKAEIRVKLDGDTIYENYRIDKMNDRSAFLSLNDLVDSEHEIILEVTDGKISIDSVQVIV